MTGASTLLLPALREAPRRFRMPLLPANAADAAAAPADVGVAFAIEQLRERRADAQLRALFLGHLASLVREALSPEGGDAAFRALVLRSQHAAVAEHDRLARDAVADRRAVRSAVHAMAHPGKLRDIAPGPLRELLETLQQAEVAADWRGMQRAAQALCELPEAPPAVRAAADDLLAHTALSKMARRELLLQDEAVRRYIALCGERGPVARTAAASAQGRASARTGSAAEAVAARDFAALARELPRCRVVRGLRTPAGFPGTAAGAKDEWDLAIVQGMEDGDDIALLAEVKASPAAATPDFARLQRGLLRLASADPSRAYAFPSADGEVMLRGTALRALASEGSRLPPHVIYCCTLEKEAQPLMLAASAKAVLLGEAASLAYARAVLGGQEPTDGLLGPVWDALPAAPRLRSALHQYQTSRIVREAMLHPADLLEAFQRLR
jgi:hypothetical protein